MTTGYRVAIRNNGTGEIRFSNWDMSWDEGSLFQWKEGNYHCDCNLSLFFYHVPPDDDRELPCGHGHFTALFAELPDGTKIDLEQRSEVKPWTPNPDFFNAT